MHFKDSPYTKSVSLDASLSTGIMNRTKKIERMANPLAVRVYQLDSVNVRTCIESRSYHDPVVPGEDCEVI